MRAARVEALTPFPLASSASCLSQASKPAAVLPHCAAPALPVIHRSATRTATVTVLSCTLLVIPNSFHAVCIIQTLPRHLPGRDRRFSRSSRSESFMTSRPLSPLGPTRDCRPRSFFTKIFVLLTRAPEYYRNGRGQTPNGERRHRSPEKDVRQLPLTALFGPRARSGPSLQCARL